LILKRGGHHEDDQLDEAQFAAWVKQASQLPGERMQAANAKCVRGVNLGEQRTSSRSSDRGSISVSKRNRRISENCLHSAWVALYSRVTRKSLCVISVNGGCVHAALNAFELGAAVIAVGLFRGCNVAPFGRNTMQRRLGSIVTVGAAVTVLLVGSVARAQNKSTIGIRFIACCINPPPGSMCCSCSDNCISMMLSPSDVAGADGASAANWNNVQGEVGIASGLVQDVGGIAVLTDATVQWQARTASSNPAASIGFVPGTGDFLLMSDYLDQDTADSTPTFVQITNIPIDMAITGYDVYVYTLTTVSNLGGTYEVNGLDPTFVLPGGNGVAIGPDYVQATPNDPIGNYVVFHGVSGMAVTITAINMPGGGKAPINGVQIVTLQ
jgi:hypothetical protein